jgi:hypothetical protein
MNKILVISLALLAILSIYSFAEGAVSLEDIEQKLAVLEIAEKNDYTALSNELAVLKSQVASLNDKMNAQNTGSNLSPLKQQWHVYAVFLCLITALFVLNISTMIRMRSLRPATAKQIVKIKQDSSEKLKQYINYCRFQKGMSAVDCRKELLSKGWTDEQLKGII